MAQKGFVITELAAVCNENEQTRGNKEIKRRRKMKR